MPSCLTHSPGRDATLFLLYILLLFPLCLGQVFRVDPSTVDSKTRKTWCAMELETCTLICDQGQMGSQDNSCDPNTLEWKCHCQTWDPPMQRYQHTLPTFMCEKTNDDCLAKNAGDVAAQNNCTVTIKRLCGDLTPAPGRPSSDKTLISSGRLAKSTSTTSSGSSRTTDTPPDKSRSSSGSLLDIKDSSESDSETPGRDTGAKVGIAVGALAGAALVACLVYIWRLRKKAAAVKITDDEIVQTQEDPKSELDGMVADQGKWVSDTPVEMEQPVSVPRELKAACTPIELDATGNTFIWKKEDLVGREKEIGSGGDVEAAVEGKGEGKLEQ